MTTSTGKAFQTGTALYEKTYLDLLHLTISTVNLKLVATNTGVNRHSSVTLQ